MSAFITQVYSLVAVSAHLQVRDAFAADLFVPQFFITEKKTIENVISWSFPFITASSSDGYALGPLPTWITFVDVFGNVVARNFPVASFGTVNAQNFGPVAFEIPKTSISLLDSFLTVPFAAASAQRDFMIIFACDEN